MPWARLMRGSRSKLNTVAFLAASARSASSAWATPKKLSSGRALGQRRPVGGARRVDPDHQPGARQRRGGVGGDGGAGLGVGAVGERGLGAGAGLDADLPARADQLLDHVGHEGHPALARTGLGGDRQFHGRSV